MSLGDAFQDPGACKPHTRVYDYVDGQLLVERQSDDSWNFQGQSPPGPADGIMDRFYSVYAWGPIGLISRRGVSIRNGFYDNEPPNPPGFVPQAWSTMCDYVPLADAMGNVLAVVDVASGNAQLQTFDAFGNRVGSAVSFHCASDLTRHDEHGLGDPVEAYRNQMAHFQWRGGEGSQTDLMHLDLIDRKEPPDPPTTVVKQAYTAPSTGFVYMGARYYEPETGRFLRSDDFVYDPVQFLSGQNNRWIYAANNPVDLTDQNGLFSTTSLLVGVGLVALGGVAGGVTNAAGGGGFWAGAAGG